MIAECVSGITVRDVETMEPVFDLLLYGVSMERLCSIPVFNDKVPEAIAREVAKDYGGGIVRRAIARRGMDPDQFFATPFDAYELKRMLTI